MSGAEPWQGSYSPKTPPSPPVVAAPSDADGEHAQAAGQHRGLVGKDVAEEVFGHNYIELTRVAH